MSEQIETKPAGKSIPKSVAYPSYSVDACIEFVTEVYNNFGRSSYTTKEALAAFRKVSNENGLLKGLISSSQQYGLLDGRYGEGYKPSELFIKILRPLPEEDVNSLKAQAMRQAPLYSKLLTEFNNDKVPTMAGLPNILTRKFSIVDTVARRAASVFLDNLNALGLVDASGMLQMTGVKPEEKLDEGSLYKNETDNFEEVEDASIKKLPAANVRETNGQQHTPTVTITEATQMVPVVIPFKNGRKIKMEIPDDFSNEEIEKTINVLNAYKN